MAHLERWRIVTGVGFGSIEAVFALALAARMAFAFSRASRFRLRSAEPITARRNWRRAEPTENRSRGNAPALGGVVIDASLRAVSSVRWGIRIGRPGDRRLIS